MVLRRIVTENFSSTKARWSACQMAQEMKKSLSPNYFFSSSMETPASAPFQLELLSAISSVTNSMMSLLASSLHQWSPHLYFRYHCKVVLQDSSTSKTPQQNSKPSTGTVCSLNDDRCSVITIYFITVIGSPSKNNLYFSYHNLIQYRSHVVYIQTGICCLNSRVTACLFQTDHC